MLDARLGKRAGFARNERLLALRPVEALVCEAVSYTHLTLPTIRLTWS